MTLERVAHRGYSAVAPENTLPAFEAAVRGGATYVEFDVRTTADGVPVVIHDRTLERTTTGFGPVWESVYSDISDLDAGAWFSPAYAGVRIPTLAETLDLLVSSGARLLLEIKPPASPDEVKAIVESVDALGLADRTVMQSFDRSVVGLIREVAPAQRRGLLLQPFTPSTRTEAVALGVTCCNPAVEDVLGDPATVAALIEAGIEVMPWTANDMTEWPALVAAGVTGLITDRVAELTGWSVRPPALR